MNAKRWTWYGDGARLGRYSRTRRGGRSPVAAAVMSAVAAACQGATVQPESESTILNGEVQLSQLVDLSAERLKINIEYDATQLRGSVTFRLGSAIDDEELWNLTNRLLASRGFTTVRRPGEDTLGVVLLNEARRVAGVESVMSARPDQSKRDDDVRAFGSGYRAVLVELAHANPDRVLTVLSAFSGEQSGNVSRVGDTSLLLLSDLSPRIEQMLAVVEEFDRSESSVVVERIGLVSVSSDTLATQLAQLLAKRQLAGAPVLSGEVMPGPSSSEITVVAPRGMLETWRNLINTLDREQLAETRTYRPRFFALDQVSGLIDRVLQAEIPASEAADWRIVENALTGSLVITATPSQHERIAELLAEVADAPLETRRSVRSFVIENRDASDILTLLEDLLRDGIFDAAEPSDLGDADSESLPTRRGGSGFGVDPDVRLTVDEGTNTLIAASEPRLLDQVGEIIDQIDVRRPQVMVEVLLISLTEGQTLDLGVELQKLVSDSGTLFAIGSLFGLSDVAPFGGGGDGAGSSDSIGSLPAPGGTAVVLNPGDFSAVVRALETISDGRSLSMPKVLVNDNESANIDSVVQEPFTSTNASDTVATTSFGGFESAGTTVMVTPQIAEGDHLTLQYSITLSSFTGESPDASTPPPRQQNSISSVATIPDGYTIAVGGIELVTDGEAESRVPLIGQIPLVGELFKNRSQSGSTSRFFAFIRSDVMRHESFEDLKFVSDPIRESMELDSDYPSLSPRIIR